jgi:hypothetical protein
MTALRKGDKVGWNSHSGTAHGTIEKKLTARTRIKGHEVAASASDPEYLVRTKEGKKAAHKPSALSRE